MLGRLGRSALIASPVCICLVPLALGLLEVQAVRAQQADTGTDRYGALLECVSPDVLDGLVFHGAANNTIVSDEVPPEMAGISPPAELDWLGSYRRDLSAAGAGIGPRGTVNAAFRTELSPEAAREAVATELSAAGWEAAPQRRFGVAGAFASAGPAQPETFCLDERSVDINANTVDGTTYVTYGFATSQTNAACQDSGNNAGPGPPPTESCTGRRSSSSMSATALTT